MAFKTYSKVAMKHFINEKEVRKPGAPVGIRTREPIKILCFPSMVTLMKYNISR